MKKTLSTLLMLVCLNNAQAARPFEEIKMQDSTTNEVEALFSDVFTIENVHTEENSMNFILKLNVPNDWSIETHEKQEEGKSMKITLETETTHDELEVDFPKGEAKITNIGDKEVTNHVYEGGVEIPITIHNANETNTIKVEYLACGKGTCNSRSQKFTISRNDASN